MEEPRVIVVKDIRVGEPAGGPDGGGGGFGSGAGGHGGGASPGWRLVQRLLSVLVGVVALVLLIPIGLVAVGCGAVVLVAVAGWLLFRAWRDVRRTTAAQATDPQRENVRVRRPDEVS